MAETPPRHSRRPSPGPLLTAGDGDPSREREADRPDTPRHGIGRLAAWAPAATAIVMTGAVLHRYGVPGTDAALFLLYVAAGVTLPGVLVLRLLYGGRRTLAEEMALGLALGYAVEVFAYAGARALGMPLLVLAWPVVTCLLFLLVPRLRRHWAGDPSRRERSPAWWSWSLALLFAYLLAWSAVSFFARNALTWPALGNAFPDMPYHLALTGELRHHMPPTVPMVAGEPLLYHWFVYAHLAAASWVTGLEPLVLLLRLGMLPVLAAFVVLAGMTGRRVTGSWAGAALTAAGTVLVTTPSLYLGRSGAFTWGGVPDLIWASPTQMFGALLFAPVVLLLIDLLDHPRRTAGHWTLLGILLVAVAGAKATYLPLLGAGLLAVAATEAVRGRDPSRPTLGAVRRRSSRPALEAIGRRVPSRPTLVALATTAACFLLAQFVLFGGAKQALVVDPFSFMRTVLEEMTGAGPLPGQGAPSPLLILGIAAVFLLGWTAAWGGITGLLCRPRLLARPGVALMLGIGAAGIGAALLLGHPGRSQLFFLWGAYPCLAALTALGITVLLRRAGQSRRATLCAAGAGLAGAYLIPFLCGVRLPLAPGTPDSALYRPYAVLVVAVLTAAIVLTLTRGRLRAWALVVTALTAVGLPAGVHARVLTAVSGGVPSGGTGTTQTAPTAPTAQDTRTARPTPGATTVTKTGTRTGTAPPPGALAAGRWLRDHSLPGDLVATNAHCRWGMEEPCDGRHFWIAALTERRVLVEGWTYTARNTARWRPGMPTLHLPFWDAGLIELNDAVFSKPTARTVRLLRERHGVRWLLADDHRRTVAPDLGTFATLRFRSGAYAVYHLPDAPP
ncbi:hypothetical protein ACLQ2R_05905 [Streptosporangium sp. DT93]|uniref:hypothetical protein n=1 Tax=Streptosporangium sp. DT93 TaxID=3393428 RepID=UPI003CF3995A